LLGVRSARKGAPRFSPGVGGRRIWDCRNIYAPRSGLDFPAFNENIKDINGASGAASGPVERGDPQKMGRPTRRAACSGSGRNHGVYCFVFLVLSAMVIEPTRRFRFCRLTFTPPREDYKESVTGASRRMSRPNDAVASWQAAGRKKPRAKYAVRPAPADQVSRRPIIQPIISDRRNSLAASGRRPAWKNLATRSGVRKIRAPLAALYRARGFPRTRRADR